GLNFAFFRHERLPVRLRSVGARMVHGPGAKLERDATRNPISSRCQAKSPSVRSTEVGLIRESRCDTDLRQRTICLGHQAAGSIEADIAVVMDGALLHVAPEQPYELPLRNANVIANARDGDLALEILFHGPDSLSDDARNRTPQRLDR